MSYVFGENVYWVKQQRGTVVVLNAFTPYNPAIDVPPHVKPKNFWYDRQVLSQAVTTRPLETGFVPPPLQTGDIFTGSDTYGWPEPPVPWWDEQRGYFLNFQTSFAYNPALDVPRFAKRVPWFMDALAGMEPQRFIKPQNLPQNWQTAGITLVTVPNVIGQLLANANATLALVGLTDQVIGSVYDSVNPVGTVSVQSPLSGNQAVLGSAVLLTLSLGPQPPPPFQGITLPQAISIAINADLIVNEPIVWQYDPVVPYNYVISQSPPAGSSSPPQTTVNFVASLGPAPAASALPIVPSVVGLMIVDAQNSLTASGCGTANVVWAYDLIAMSGYVLAQSIAPGTVVPVGTPVVLTVSQGAPVTTPATGGQIVIPVMH